MPYRPILFTKSTETTTGQPVRNIKWEAAMQMYFGEIRSANADTWTKAAWSQKGKHRNPSFHLQPPTT